MLIAGLVLSVFGLGFFCWLLFTLAIFALPFLAGLTAGLAAFHSGAGFIGALIVGVLVGGATLALGRIAFATVRTPLIRVFIGLLYAVPATIAGYQVSFGLAGIGVPPGDWHEAFAAGGAVLAGITAFARLALFIPPETGQRIVEGSAYSPIGLRQHDQRG
ncbi:hypothetical protein [Reyranella sp.]|uniref:hypothetical protein n=1 Tax=Reyranella sp. TaxID=1929291 RepID=UPI0027318177|nr:hypothetical protein [Reyranella sp.]MDP2377174.1 hypothetical protein [Reyranella sp.]